MLMLEQEKRELTKVFITCFVDDSMIEIFCSLPLLIVEFCNYSPDSEPIPNCPINSQSEGRNIFNVSSQMETTGNQVLVNRCRQQTLYLSWCQS
jgi:hypothetical protein